MKEQSEGARPVTPLRERKKLKTKATIRRQALRLFREQGFDATSVEQVAEAAEVSVSTVFRYFPTKEDLVVADDYDPLFIEAFQAQPAELSPLKALRTAIHTTLGGTSRAELDENRTRESLMLTVPALWAASLRNITASLNMMGDLVAKRVGREPDDPAVRSFTGAVMGTVLVVWLDWANNPEMDVVTALDDALAHLDAGLPL
ncbi:TetR family transcriptional regulator [Solwaraspora sp. WMMD1047]|uniref:acyl-CoA-like ligand-binding transcription factor n=1 Tax=Solwaraspora sp. WMMD1047 TaxID=3016102 RepID=UPI002417BB68|nr:TetR family transcriptional regulator [Solwaraspora sp. WMMD1047]MDG4830629.1 TetR family transcriptional regulator [Solwaraspora sp. WMMD1047]